MKLVGHYNPSFDYPAVVIPICIDSSNRLLAAYSCLGEVSFEQIPGSCVFVSHSEDLCKTIGEYDPSTAGLFAYSTTHVVPYPRHSEALFFREQIESQKFLGANPFTRLILAKKSEDLTLIEEAIRGCLIELYDMPENEFAESWYEHQRERTNVSLPKDSRELWRGKTLVAFGSFFADELLLRRLSRAFNADAADTYIVPALSDRLPSAEKDPPVPATFIVETDPNVRTHGAFFLGFAELVLAVHPNFVQRHGIVQSWQRILMLAQGDENFFLVRPNPQTPTGRIFDTALMGFIPVDANEAVPSAKTPAQKPQLILPSGQDLFTILAEDARHPSTLFVLKRHVANALFTDAEPSQQHLLVSHHPPLYVGYELLSLLSDDTSLTVFERFANFCQNQGGRQLLLHCGIIPPRRRLKKMTTSHDTYQVFKVGDLVPGEKADYEITELATPVGERAQTYVAKITKCKQAFPRELFHLNPGSSVIIKTVNIAKDLSEGELHPFLDKLNLMLRTEFGALGKLRNLECVAKQIDIGFTRLKLDTKFPAMATFVVQEYIKGERLDTYLKNAYPCHHRPERTFCGIPTEAEWFDLSKKLTKALLHVHMEGVIHQDIWPPNIMIRDESKDPVFIDFGEAIFRDFVPPESTRHRSAGHTYIPPEWRKNLKSWPSRRSELYSFASLLLYMASGEAPPEEYGDTDKKVKDCIVSLFSHANPELYEANNGIADIIVGCLRQERENRVPDTESLLQRIETFERHIKKPDLEETVSRVEKLVSQFGTPKNAFFTRLVDFELRKLENRISDMNYGVLDISGDREEMEWTLTQYLSVLEGDEYLTISTPQFWSTDNLGTVGPYLTINKILAQRGVRLRRLFLLTEQDSISTDHNDPNSVYNILLAHQQMQESLETKDGSPAIETRYVIVQDDETRRSMIRSGEHNGICISKEDALELFLIYDNNKILRTVRLRHVKGDQENRRQTFYKKFQTGRPLADWLYGPREAKLYDRTATLDRTSRPSSLSLFYSYSRKDKPLRDELDVHLTMLKKSGVLTTWHDREIEAGDDWKIMIHDELESAHIILLLVSPDFLASQYCYEVEMKRALERHKEGTAMVIPVILRPVDWKSAPFAHLNALPPDGKPITAWTDRDEAFLRIVNGVRNALSAFTSG